MDISTFIQLLLSGLLLGGIYAMVAVGLALCFGVLGLLNLAHGAFLVLAGFVFQAVHGLWPTGTLAGFIISGLVVFYAARAYRMKNEGIDISWTFQSIPPV